ncbi:site-specific DNA-methyltransferase (cytosine-N4-specific) [Methanocalculus alkaliphilus]|uniref:DNA-methyltransferase n=1 Tax=Methanocalculus alkaliphilus TaxID=768730 RepID=UPI00209E7B8F|nr:site-specific DNA-methyltransferase [Methanocalculus alkaliphilus]MCP1715679.1 site-specific DNA-methyltransferase (cytosine-N4-specific) [Methanocalculus alkaliphilus]
MKTSHKLYFECSSDISSCIDESVNLVVTSPPYPMIEMWDELFSLSNEKILDALNNYDGERAFELMHKELDKVWIEADRVLKQGGYFCINIGDATRTIGKSFKLYPNHVRVSECFNKLGYDTLPCIIWRKPSNKPTKFMGSGMLAPNAYVTMEHEYILIFRKGSKRTFLNSELEKRRKSAYFWEERNIWFSDVWMDLKGVSQKLNHTNLRKVTAAFPLELVYRLINMYSIQEDIILDPFLGTGTTTIAAMLLGRNSIGCEINPQFESIIRNRFKNLQEDNFTLYRERIEKHKKFLEEKNFKSEPKYFSKNYGFPVVTNQEVNISFPLVTKIYDKSSTEVIVEYNDNTNLESFFDIKKNSVLSDFL